MNNKLIYAILAIVVLNLGITWAIQGGAGAIGGTTNYDLLDTTDGYAVDGTVVVDTNGLFVGTVSGTITSANTNTFSGANTFTGDTRIAKLVETGSRTALSQINATSTLTATLICDNAVLTIASTSAISIEIVSSTALIADCITTTGDTKRVVIQNNAAGSTTLVVAQGGAGSTTILTDLTYGSIGVNSQWVLDFMASGSDVIVRRTTFR